MGLNSITLANINLDDNKFHKNDPETNNHVKTVANNNKY